MKGQKVLFPWTFIAQEDDSKGLIEKLVYDLKSPSFHNIGKKGDSLAGFPKFYCFLVCTSSLSNTLLTNQTLYTTNDT